MSEPADRASVPGQAVTSPEEWGRRLSDRLRAGLDAGDLARARRLALEGDGQARSLEKEYTLMYRGLGITIGILLDLAGETAAGRLAAERDRASRGLADALGRFREDLEALLGRIYPESAAPRDGAETTGGPPAGTLDGEIEATARLLAEAERRFLREQASRAEEILRAIESGDARRARALVDRKERGEYLPLHDRLVRFMAELFGWVLTEFGPAELSRFHRATAERQRAGFEKWERLPADEFARATAFLLKQHMGNLEVREDGEKFTFLQAPCGSGGRLRLAGAYAGPGALPFVEERGALTAGLDRFPVYCSHCPIWNMLAPIEWFGRPQWVFEDPARPDGACTLHVYKRRDAVPAAYYRRLGLARAER